MAIVGWWIGVLLIGQAAQVAEEDVATRIQVLALQLKDGDAAQRGLAASALGDLGAKARSAVPNLIEALGDDNRLVRYRTIRALGKIGPDAEDAVPVLMEVATGAPDAAEAEDARKTLVNIGAPAVPALIAVLRQQPALGSVLAQIGRPAVPALRDTLQNPDADFRRASASVLGLMGPEADDAVANLMNRLGDEDTRVGAQAAKALGAIGSEEAVSALVEALEQVGVRGQAIVALGKLGPKAARATPRLVAFQKDTRLAPTAGEALAAIGPPALEQVVRGMTGDDAETRLCSARALTWFGAETAVPRLVEALGSDRDEVRANAAEALAMLGPAAKRASTPLLNALHDPNPYAQAHAESALEKIVTVEPALVPDLRSLLSNRSLGLRLYAAVILSRLGSRGVEAVPVLVEALRVPDAKVRLRILKALADIGTAAESALPAIEAAERDSEREVRALATKTLKSVRVSR
jgi:HEAT repeat protein